MRKRAKRRVRSRATATYVLLAVVLATSMLWPTGVHADEGGLAVRADTIRVASNPLEVASLGFARAVARASGGDLQRFLVADGIRLQLDGLAHNGISSRQAVASLREFLRNFDDGQTFLSRAEPVDGSPDRGFAEVLWSGRAAGTSDQIRRILFLGLFREQGNWRVDEVRLLR